MTAIVTVTSTVFRCDACTVETVLTDSLFRTSRLLIWFKFHSISTYASRTSAYALNKKRKILEWNENEICTAPVDGNKLNRNNEFRTQWCLSETQMRINERNLESYVRADSLSVTHTIILIENRLFQKLKNKSELSRKTRKHVKKIERRKKLIFFICLKKIVFYSRSRTQILENSVKFSFVLCISHWKAALVTKKKGDAHYQFSHYCFYNYFTKRRGRNISLTSWIYHLFYS